MTKKSLVNNILAVATMTEGVCAAAVVDAALKNVSMNTFVKTVGRSAVSTIVTAPFAIAATALIMEGQKDESSHKDSHKEMFKMTFVDANCKKTKSYYKPGEVVELDATPYLPEGTEFLYWYSTKGEVEFLDNKCAKTSFIMPEENVRVEFAIFGSHRHESAVKKDDISKDNREVKEDVELEG